MKVGIARVVGTAIAALLGTVGVPTAIAEIPNFASGFSQTQICPIEGCVIFVKNGGHS